MGRAGLSSLSNRLIVLGLILVLAACSRPAADLPPDYGSVSARKTVTLSEFSESDRKLACPDIDLQRAALKVEADELTGKVMSHRQNNQTAGYIGAVLFPPVLFALELSEDDKAALDRIQGREDALIKLKSIKRCQRADR
jgi:hypothetical protein